MGGFCSRDDSVASNIEPRRVHVVSKSSLAPKKTEESPEPQTSQDDEGKSQERPEIKEEEGIAAEGEGEVSAGVEPPKDEGKDEEVVDEAPESAEDKAASAPSGQGNEEVGNELEARVSAKEQDDDFSYPGTSASKQEAEGGGVPCHTVPLSHASSMTESSTDTARLGAVSTPESVSNIHPQLLDGGLVKPHWQQLPTLSPQDVHSSAMLRPSNQLHPWPGKPALTPLGHPSTGAFQQQPGPSQVRQLKVVKPKCVASGLPAASGIFGRQGSGVSRGGYPVHSGVYRPMNPYPPVPKHVQQYHQSHIDMAAGVAAAAALRGACAQQADLESRDSAMSSRGTSLMDKDEPPPDDSFDLSASLPASKFQSTRESRTFTDQELLGDNQTDMAEVAFKLRHGLTPSRGHSSGSKPGSSCSHRSNWQARNTSGSGAPITEEETELIAFSRENLGPSRFSVLSTVAEDALSPQQGTRMGGLGSVPEERHGSLLERSDDECEEDEDRFASKNAGAAGSGKAQVLTFTADGREDGDAGYRSAFERGSSHLSGDEA